MFSFIKGKVHSVSSSVVTLENTDSSLGYAVVVAQPHAFIIGSSAMVYTYMHWNQEQGPTLFGFSDELEKAVFLLIISCSGIGPKIALAALSELTPVTFLQAVQEGQVKVLSSVSGIGTKKAEQIIVTLKDKVSKMIQSEMVLKASGSTGNLSEWNNIAQVLQSLNYSKGEIDMALSHITSEYSGKSLSFEEYLRKALSFLSKKR